MCSAVLCVLRRADAPLSVKAALYIPSSHAELTLAGEEGPPLAAQAAAAESGTTALLRCP